MPGIQLVDEEEELVYRFGESTVWYRRITNREQRRIEKNHTKRGETDARAVLEDMFDYCIRQWGKVTLRGQDTPFEKKLIWKLPAEIRNEMIDCFYAADPGDEEKNGLKTGSTQDE